MGNQDALPDAILELVFLGLDSVLCLHRAASTCKRWRRIIASDAFRALYSRPSVVAGTYYNKGIRFLACFEPSPSAAAAVDTRHFSLDFLPGDGIRYQRIKDSRGSLLLLFREHHKIGHWELIVCEPLTRRLEVIPQPDPSSVCRNATLTLLDGDGSVAIGMSSFRVLLCSNNEVGRIYTCMFTSGRSSWRETSIDMPPKLHNIGLAVGRRYWHDGEKTVVALDQSALEFSSFVLPDDEGWDRLMGKVTLVVGRDGEARIVIEGSGNILKIFARQKSGGGEDAEEWALEKTIEVSAAMLSLPQVHWYYVPNWNDLADQHEDVGMVRIRVSAASGSTMSFCVDMETTEAKRLPMPNVYVRKAYPSLFPWPPSLIACTDDNTNNNRVA